MIEAGRYVAKAIEWKLGLTQSGGEQIGVLFQLKEGGATITWYGYFTEKTTDRTLESLERMGWDGVDITDPKGIDTNEVQLVIELETSEKDGKQYPRVRWINSIGGGLAMKEELAGGALQSFKARMAGTLMSRRQGKPAPAQRQARSQPARGSDDFGPTSYGPDDEIPF